MKNNLNAIYEVLKKDSRLVGEDGSLLKNKIYELSMKMDSDLLKLLLSDPATKEIFFVDVDGVPVFDKSKFGWLIDSKDFLPDSFTAFKNKIMLTDENGNSIQNSKSTVITFPYKDCVLEGGQSTEDENRDEIISLRIIYDQKYKDRPMVITQLKGLYEKLKAKGITIERLWDCYAIKKPEKVKRGAAAQLADLISIIRFEMGYTENLAPFADRVNYNFMQWTLRRNAGAVHFTDEQMEWLRLVKDHIAVSLSIELTDLDLNPFDRKGGLGRFYEVFGTQYESILHEMNVELVA